MILHFKYMVQPLIKLSYYDKMKVILEKYFDYVFG